MKRVISLLLVAALSATLAFARTEEVGRSFTYESEVSFGKGSFSGICTVEENEGSITGVFVNEFGITAFSFEYNKSAKRVKLLNIIDFLDKWYIRKTLRKDLRAIAPALADPSTPIFGEIEYTNIRRKIEYRFKLLTKENETGE